MRARRGWSSSVPVSKRAEGERCVRWAEQRETPAEWTTERTRMTPAKNKRIIYTKVYKNRVCPPPLHDVSRSPLSPTSSGFLGRNPPDPRIPNESQHVLRETQKPPSPRERGTTCSEREAQRSGERRTGGKRETRRRDKTGDSGHAPLLLRDAHGEYTRARRHLLEDDSDATPSNTQPWSPVLAPSWRAVCGLPRGAHQPPPAQTRTQRLFTRSRGFR